MTRVFELSEFKVGKLVKLDKTSEARNVQMSYRHSMFRVFFCEKSFEEKFQNLRTYFCYVRIYFPVGSYIFLRRSVYILLPIRMYFSLLFIKPFHRQMCFKEKHFIKQKTYEKDFICFVGDMYISFCQCAGVSFYATYRSEFC